MDECGSSVCGDSVQPHIFDEPDLTYHDLDLLPTPVEDPKGDEGSKDEPEPTSAVEFSNMKGYPLIFITTDGKYRTDIKCEHCNMSVAFTMKLSPTDKDVPYHLYYEQEKEEGDKKHKCQIVGLCEYAYRQ